ncbi:hypothetical protein E2562_005852 [Oryza meyeriana var. granulata]|uniref:U-box domain-containing protein n=2 Tax=Oryza meyeriana var. granulata TaxID=110450 RepID=A0A6G1CES4_9ORYZ|nr:hypothetical protein E2562_005852 [Oryza meyeriana var. granulata]KAF0898264.1 hypothetical protein E2562_005852 [Oryza meyeriana var. granulata]
MLPPLAAAAPPAQHAATALPHLLRRRHHLGHQLLLRRHRLRAAPAGVGHLGRHCRVRRLLAGAYAPGDGGAGQDVDSSESTSSTGSAYIGLFVRMLGLDNDPRDREHAVYTIWQYSLGGRKYIDEIMQFHGCVVLIVSLLKSDSARACEAATGLLRNITSVKLYRDVAVESGAMEEIFSLLCKSTITPEMLEQSLCTIWNFSIDENLRYKILSSDILTRIVRILDDEDIKVKEAAAGIISNLALSRSNHGALVEAGVIPKLVQLLQNKEDDYKIIRKEAKCSLLELSADEYYHNLIIEEGLVRVPLVGSAAYKAFRPLPHSWPSFPDGSEIQRSCRPSKYGATELLLGLSVDEKEIEPDEAKINAMKGRSNQQFLARIGAIELDDEGKEQSGGSQKNDLYTILPWVDGVARLVLIIGLEDASAIAKAAKAIGDASTNEHMRSSFKEAGAVKPLLQLLKHTDMPIREVAAYALERLSVSAVVCEKIKTDGGLKVLVDIVKDPNIPVEQLEKIINTLSRIFDTGISMVAVDAVYSEKSTQGDIDGGTNGTYFTYLKQEETSSVPIIDFDVILRLTKVLKEASPSLQEKAASILEHLAAFDQHATAMTAARLGSVIEAILEMGVIHGTTGDPENFDELPTVMIEQVSRAVSATVRLLTKLLNFDLFVRSISTEKFIALLRQMLKSSIPLQSKDWLAACLIKLQSSSGLSGHESVSSVDMEITIYETIPRLVEQMMTSLSFEDKRNAVIELNKIVSGGVMEYTRAVSTAGGIFPLVKMIEDSDGDALEASLAILYNLTMDPENHPAIIAAGAVPLLKQIVVAESTHWNRALQLLRTLPV